MAKQSIIQRELKRDRLVKKYAAKRAALKVILSNPEATDEERFDARTKLSELPRNSSPTRQQRRCSLTGRPHGVYRRFGLGRTKIREVVMQGKAPGVVKASW